jgi:hypothetical protein
MTVFEVRIDRLVLRDVPPEYAAGLDAAVARAIGEAAGRSAGDEPAPAGRAPLAGRDALAAHIGQSVWASIREGRP